MDGIVRIDKVAALLDVWLDPNLFPFPKLRVKVLERSSNDFLAVTNVLPRDPKTGELGYVSGLGGSIDESVDDLLCRFVADVRKYSETRTMTAADFEWSAAEDF